MVERAVKDAIDAIVGERPGVGDGYVSSDFQEEYSDDVAQLTLTRYYSGDDIPLFREPDSDGVVRNSYSFYISTSALSLVEVARKVNPAKEGLDGVTYMEVGNNQDSLSGVFYYAESGDDGLPSYSMLRDLVYLDAVIARMIGRERVRLASFAGSKVPPVEGDFDLVSEIVSLLEVLGETMTAGIDDLGGKLKISSKLWDPRERPDDIRKIIGDAAAFLNSAASGLKNDLDQLVGLSLDAVNATLATLEKVLERGIDAIIEFFEEKFGDRAASIKAARQLVSLVLQVVGTMRDKLSELRAFGYSAATWFDQTFGEVEESIDVLIGYFAGVWNGLVDAVLGIFDTVNLAISIVLGLFRLGDTASEAWNLSLELVDEVIQGLADADLMTTWDDFTENVFPELIDALTRHGSEIADAMGHTLTTNNAAVGYYFGYMVYMAAEMFFPPIKLTKVARGARRSAQATSAFFKRLSKFTGE